MKQKGYADIVLGLQFGDEGKARVIDNLASQYDIVARFNGGTNAGHTISHAGHTIALHQIPSGIFYPKTTLYIGSGCVINLEKVAEEIKEIKALGIDISKRLHISSQASIVQPHHLLLDEMWGKGVGTTNNGVGPSYADQAMRMYGVHWANVRLGDLKDNPEQFEDYVLYNFEMTKKRYKIKGEDRKKIMNRLKKAFEEIKPYIELDPLYLEKRVEKGASVLFEGAQSVMLDVVKGSVPYVTSSHTIAAAAYVGGDLSMTYHRKTIGIAKAIMSRVGHGPFPSEFGGRESEDYCTQTNEEKTKNTQEYESEYNAEGLLGSTDPFYQGIALRMLSKEYGATTHRPRRVGRMDLVQLQYATRMNGIDELILTKCDILNIFSKMSREGIPTVTGYKLDGKTIDYVPAASEAFYRVKPIIEYKSAFHEDISEIRSYKDLPIDLKKYLTLIEKTCNSKIVGISVGPKREQYITIS